VFHLMSACLGMKVGSGGRMACRALAAPNESVCCIDGVARVRVSRKILFEDRQRPERTIGRVARDLTKFVFAQLNLV
jgi:hypothetical protein